MAEEETPARATVLEGAMANEKSPAGAEAIARRKSPATVTAVTAMATIMAQGEPTKPTLAGSGAVTATAMATTMAQEEVPTATTAAAMVAGQEAQVSMPLGASCYNPMLCGNRRARVKMKQHYVGCARVDANAM